MALRHPGRGSVPIRSHEKSLREKRLRIEQATPLAAADIEDGLRLWCNVGNHRAKQQVIHHRCGLFPGEVWQLLEVRRKGKVAPVEKAFPADRREAVQHLVGSKIKEMQGQPDGGRRGRLPNSDKIRHEGSLDSTGNETLVDGKTTGMCRMQWLTGGRG